MVLWVADWILLLLKFNSAPGFPWVILRMPVVIFASFMDRTIMPGKLYLGNHDPEGFTSTYPGNQYGPAGYFNR